MMAEDPLGLDSTAPEDLASLTPSRELGSMASVLAALARTGPVALAEGTLVADQYRIERPIGEGGMGVVFLARDTRLDRPVAVKLCTGLSASAVHRIQREAMALAKLAHPNVVVVFQAGDLDGRFFIAMEHVAGGTARSWLAAAPRSTREILALYIDAGTGLAAAHAEGLVHRDFKPDNVLVGVDGRPRVADFGLVRASSHHELDATVEPSARPTGLVTQAGAVMGTLAYMAPEQLEGQQLDARADQYSFAASLWEALFHWRPAVGGMRPEELASTRSLEPLEGAPSAAPASARPGLEPERAPGVPRHVVAALRRALAEDPALRWPELGALLAELRRDPAGARRRMMLGVAALGLTAVVTATVMAGAREPSPVPCEDGAERIATVWSPERRVALLDAMGTTAWPAIEQRVQARADAWIETYGRACRATHVDHEASEEQLYRRMLCLEARRGELDATLGALASGSRTVESNAAEAFDLLPASEGCLDPAANAAQVLPPNDPELRVQIAAAQRAVADVEAAALDPTVLDPDGKAERAVTLARATGWAPVIASALIARGAVSFNADRLEAAISDYGEAARLALAAGSDALALEALAGAAWPLDDLERTQEAGLALELARALWERIGQPPFEERLLLGAEADRALREHRPRDALAKTREQIEVTERTLEVPATMSATNQYNLGIALERVGELDAATQAAARAIELARAELGDEHPTVARYMALAAKVAGRRGDYPAAIELASRALALDERWFGPESNEMTLPLDVLAEAARRQGRIDDSIAFSQRHLAIRRHHDPHAPEIPKLEANLAIAEVERGDFASAAPLAERSLASLEQRYGPDDPTLIVALVLTGYIARERPEPDLVASERDLARALALAESKLGPDDTETINTEIELANTLVAKGDHVQAIARLERRLAQLDELELPLHQPSELRFALAGALAAKGERTRACALAGEAELRLRELQMSTETQARWRAEHCAAAAPDLR